MSSTPVKVIAPLAFKSSKLPLDFPTRLGNRGVTSKKSHVTRHNQGFLPVLFPRSRSKIPFPPLPQRTMDLNIYRENTQDRLVKDELKHRALYFIRSPPKIFSTPAKQVYRGDSESSPRMAKIRKNGHLFPQFCIKLEDQQVILDTNKRDSKSTTFDVDGKEFVWETDQDLYDAETGKIVARFVRTGFGVKKMGVLSIIGDGLEMIDIVVLTAIAMQYHWEEIRRKG
jgi:hypothetical protein